MKSLALLVLSSALFLACGEPATTEPASSGPAATEKAPGDEPPVERAALVKETVSTEKYTFARMDACGKEAWVAGPVSAFEEGQTVDMKGGMGMEEFHSETLDRTFDKILFVDSWAVSDKPLVCDEKPVMDPAKETKEFRIGTVKETVDAGGYTYARLDVCGEDVWVAAPTTRVEVGSFGATPVGNEMKEFKSTSLERTFDSVWFVAWIKRSPKLPPCE